MFPRFPNLTFPTSMGIPEPRGKDSLNLRERSRPKRGLCDSPRFKAYKFLACLLSNDFARILVFPNSEIDRMPKTIISGPLCEFHLADHRRFNPVATPHFGSGQPLVPTAATHWRKVIKGTGIGPDFLQFRIETAQKLTAKAGPDPPAQFEVLAFVKADQKRAEIFP